jgi:predicted tellurium resistance membrane protein TerC
MSFNKYPKIVLVCGLICLIAGVVMLIAGANLIQENSFYNYAGVLFACLGAVFVALSFCKTPPKSPKKISGR